MTFYKTDCPECCEKIILDVINGFGYCMYCGAKVEPEELVPLPNSLRETIFLELNKDDVAEPWDVKVSESIDLAQSGDIDGCIAGLRSVLENAENKQTDDILDSIDKAIVNWIISGITDRNLPMYEGGAHDVYEGIKDLVGEGMDYAIVNVCRMHMSMISNNLNDPEMAKRLIKTTFMVLKDYINDIHNLEELVDFITGLNYITHNAINIAYPNANENKNEYMDEPTFRYYNFLLHLAFMAINETKGMKRKDLVKINRSVSAGDMSEALKDINSAIDLVLDKDPDAYFEPFKKYMDHMLGKNSKNTKKKN